MCDLNCSVQGRVSSLRTSFWTPPNLNSEASTLIWTSPNFNSEVSKPKILLFSYWFFIQIGWVGSVGHLRTLSVLCSELRFGGVQKLVLELETRSRTEPFRIHVPNIQTRTKMGNNICSFIGVKKKVG